MREKIVRGVTTITFIGGGYESRQALRRKVHEHLGTWDALQRALAPEAETSDVESDHQVEGDVAVPGEGQAYAAA